ncbi:hypothetical protein NDI37_17535 [Funiculus sociatus GB2-A5]|uniref:Uncharacterized protein n=1 Tax=Funiculus sociatus GB2-A5 TaxID=2933946 RepID=A0ABV0JS97_9CYAN|nr:MULTISPECIES: hypothetical protein [unclassified Trichocoleus]MBD1906957.1 hypothetical protein [Trichocoleus sp. FACHB-832]MBD2063353.1 hypothetical protein [Trichocoleus sp. FACHB-6]
MEIIKPPAAAAIKEILSFITHKSCIVRVEWSGVSDPLRMTVSGQWLAIRYE